MTQLQMFTGENTVSRWENAFMLKDGLVWRTSIV